MEIYWKSYGRWNQVPFAQPLMQELNAVLMTNDAIHRILEDAAIRQVEIGDEVRKTFDHPNVIENYGNGPLRKSPCLGLFNEARRVAKVVPNTDDIKDAATKVISNLSSAANTDNPRL